MPTGDPQHSFNHTNIQERLASETWRHSSEVLQKKVVEQGKIINALETELNHFRYLEQALGGVHGGSSVHINLCLESTLQALAELLATKYPQEDAPVVRNLVAMFVDRVEYRLEEEGAPTEPESER